jgi:hypothetical protein
MLPQNDPEPANILKSGRLSGGVAAISFRHGHVNPPETHYEPYGGARVLDLPR